MAATPSLLLAGDVVRRVPSVPMNVTSCRMLLCHCKCCCLLSRNPSPTLSTSPRSPTPPLPTPSMSEHLALRSRCLLFAFMFCFQRRRLSKKTPQPIRAACLLAVCDLCNLWRLHTGPASLHSSEREERVQHDFIPFIHRPRLRLGAASSYVNIDQQFTVHCN